MFRPTFETLENREVFSAAPLVLPPDTQSLSLNFAAIEMENKSRSGGELVSSDSYHHAIIAVMIGLRADRGDASNTQRGLTVDFLEFSAKEHLVAHESITGHGLVGDFNNDGRDVLAGIASQGLSDRILPYIEQDNVLGLEDVLISHLTGQLRGEAIDIIPLVQQPVESDSDAAAHDAVFSPQGPGCEGYETWDDPRQQQIIAVLIGLLADHSTGTIAGDFLDLLD